MDIESKDASSLYFKNFMRFRKQTIVEISENTGINKRTLQGYAQGNPPFKNAHADTFIKITDYMGIDPHYMLGLSDWKLSDFYKNFCLKHNLKSIRNICEVSDIHRLTPSTIKYRRKKKKLKKATMKFEKIRDEADSAGRNENTLKVDFIDHETVNLTFFVNGEKYSMVAHGGENELKDSLFSRENIPYRRRMNADDTSRVLEFIELAKEIEDINSK